LGRSSGESARFFDDEALRFVEAVLACLEAGEMPVIESLRQYPRYPEPAGPPVWRRASDHVRRMISESGIAPRVLLLAVWDGLPSLMTLSHRGSGSDLGRRDLRKWAADRSPEARLKAKQAAEQESAKWDGFFGEESRAALRRIQEALEGSMADHASTRFARRVASGECLRIHRGAGGVLGMSRRMICYWRGQPAYEQAVDLIAAFKLRCREKFPAVVPSENDSHRSDDSDEIDFDAMDARLEDAEVRRSP
jgi:hypothetical protein